MTQVQSEEPVADQAMSEEHDAKFRSLLAVAQTLRRGEPGFFARLCRRHLPEFDLNSERATAARAQFDAAEAVFCNRYRLEPELISNAIRDLTMGELDGLVVVDASATGLDVVAIGVDDLAVPQFREPIVNVDWRSLLEDLPADPTEQSVVLASGDDRRGFDKDRVANVLEGYLQQFGVKPSVRTSHWRLLMIQRLFGWAISDIVRESLDAYVGADTIADCYVQDEGNWNLLEVLSTAVADAPLRYEYSLLFAEVDSANHNVKVVSRPLFYQDTTRNYSEARQDRVITASLTARNTVQIAIVARTGHRADVERLVAGAELPLPAGQTCKLWFRLEGPGLVTFPNPPVSLLPLRDSLAEIRAGVPARASASYSTSVDLVCVLDLIGTSEAVERRKQMVIDVVQYLQQHHPAANSLQVGLIAFRDAIHVQAEAQKMSRPRILERVELGDSQEVLRRVEQLTAFEHDARDLAGGIDVATTDLPNFLFRANCETAMFTITAHPPHPPRQGAHKLIPNASGQDWFRPIEDLRDQRHMRSVLAVDNLDWRLPVLEATQTYIDDCWIRLGYTYRSDLDGARPEVFANRLDPSLAQASQTLRLPILRD